MHYFSYINSKWFRQTDKHTNITQTIRIFWSLVPVLNKLPDHHNLPFFNDMLHFWYQSRVSLFVHLGFFVSIKTISFDIKLNHVKFFYLSKNDYSKSADQSESSGKSVIIAAVLAWNPGQALSWNPRHA